MFGATASGNTLTKTAAAGWGNSGGLSAQTLDEVGLDGYVEVAISSETDTLRYLGLSNYPTLEEFRKRDQQSIDFAMGLNFGPEGFGQMSVYESGLWKADDPNLFAPGDALRITVNGGVVYYLHNGTVIYRSLVAPAYPLLVDAALFSEGSSITAVVSPSWVAHSMHEIEADLGNLGVWVNLTPDLLA